jgi:glycine cleavage system aminomethyltransferase T
VSTTDSSKSLQNVLDLHPDLVDYFYNDTSAPHFSRSGKSNSYVPPEFTNWRDEQRSWSETAVLFDQTHHMPELFLSGPGALALLERIGVNSFEKFVPGKAKQLVACAPDGNLIGDCILYYLEDGRFELVSGATLLDWVEYQASLGEFDVRVERDNATLDNASGRRTRFRLQLDGPNAGTILDQATEGGAPEIPFFNTATITIASREVLALRHGMAGHKGVELSGDFDDLEVVRSALLEVGARHGLLQGGTRAYFSSVLESGWIAYPVPAVYTDDSLRGFREWLPARSWAARTQLGGSYVAGRIEDYYVNPYEFGYGKVIRFDHDFIGREALEALDEEKERRKVTLVWNNEDVAAVFSSQFGSGPRFKAIEFPLSYFAFPQHDEIRSTEGKLVGISMRSGYSNNEGVALSLAVIDAQFAEPGTDVVLTWGEPNGGSRKPQVERHSQTTIRATVQPAPYSANVRRMKTLTVGGPSVTSTRDVD